MLASALQAVHVATAPHKLNPKRATLVAPQATDARNYLQKKIKLIGLSHLSGCLRRNVIIDITVSELKMHILHILFGVCEEKCKPYLGRRYEPRVKL